MDYPLTGPSLGDNSPIYPSSVPLTWGKMSAGIFTKPLIFFLCPDHLPLVRIPYKREWTSRRLFFVDDEDIKRELKRIIIHECLCRETKDGIKKRNLFLFFEFVKPFFLDSLSRQQVLKPNRKKPWLLQTNPSIVARLLSQHPPLPRPRSIPRQNH
jgi:hypothetical protein